MSAKTLLEFTSELRKRNIARPALYHVSLGLPPKLASTSNRSAMVLASMWCASVATPDVTMLTNDNYVENGIKRKFAYDYDYNDLSLTFYIDQEYEIKKFFDDWMKAIVPYQRRFNYPDDYTADTLFLNILNQNDQDTFQYRFKRIYPKSITPIDLNYASGSAISTFTVNFVFEEFEYVKFYIDPTSNNTSNTQEYSSEPAAPVTNTQTPTSGDNSVVSPFLEVALPSYVTGAQNVTAATFTTSQIQGALTSTVSSYMTQAMPTLLSAAMVGNLPSALTTILGASAGNALQGIITQNFPAFNSIIMSNLPPMEAIIAQNLPAYGNSLTNIPRILADKMPQMISLVVSQKMPQILALVNQNLP